MAALTQYRIMEAWGHISLLRSLITPQVAIMSFDGIIKKPVIIEDENGDKIGIGRWVFWAKVLIIERLMGLMLQVF